MCAEGEGKDYGKQEAGSTSGEQVQEHCETETQKPRREEQQPRHRQSPV